MIKSSKKKPKTGAGRFWRLAALVLPAALAVAAYLAPVPAALAASDCIKTSVQFNGTNCVPVSKNGNPADNPIFTVLFDVINFLAVGAGIAVVGGIVWGSLLYVTSDGDPGKAKQGIIIIMNSFLGLLLFIFMYAALNFLVPGGLFKK